MIPVAINCGQKLYPSMAVPSAEFLANGQLPLKGSLPVVFSVVHLALGSGQEISMTVPAAEVLLVNDNLPRVSRQALYLFFMRLGEFQGFSSSVLLL